jgi:hypothetical protein
VDTPSRGNSFSPSLVRPTLSPSSLPAHLAPLRAAPPPGQLISLRSFSASGICRAPLSADRKRRAVGDAPEAAAAAPGGWSRREVLNWPNALSLGRLLSGPLLAAWILQGRWELAAPGLAISAATDWLDGWLARRAGLRSVLGSYLDPLADKVLVGCVVGALGHTVSCN